MEVKGIAFLARQAMAEATYGPEAWRAFLQRFAEREPVFAQPVMPVTRLPVRPFLALHEALVDTFHGGDTQVYWRFGEAAGVHALTQGRMKGLFAHGELQRFLNFMPSSWRGYFTAGQLDVQALEDGNGLHTAELRIHGVPHPHPYFEYSILGFVRAGLLELGASSVELQPLAGYSRGDDEVRYLIRYA